jgi:uncharacterized protein (TIGR02996 family)
MSDQLALLAAIRDNPEDDTIRLVYADWLEEYGQANRAEFIPVQIELTRLPQWWCSPDLHTRRQELYLHERELIQAHGRAWVDGVRVQELLISPCTVTFRRGFPEQGYFDIGYLRASAAGVLTHPLLRDLCITGIDDNTLAELLTFPWLAELRGLAPCRGNAWYDLPAQDWNRLADCPHLSRLESLSLGGLGVLNREGAARVANNLALEGVRKLGFMEQPGARAVSALLGGCAFRSLTKLEVNDYGYPTPPAIPDLSENPRLARLEYLSLRGYSVDRAGAEAITTAAFWPTLRELTFGEGTLEPEALEVLGAATGGGLETLHLIQNLPARATGLFGPFLRTVRGLHFLAHQQMDAGVVAQLAECEYAAGLRSLSFSGCLQIGDAEASEIARSPVFGGLHSLDLGNTGVRPPGALALVASPYLGALTSLVLYGCDLDEWTKAALRKRFGDRVWLDP